MWDNSDTSIMFPDFCAPTWRQLLDSSLGLGDQSSPVSLGPTDLSSPECGAHTLTHPLKRTGGWKAGMGREKVKEKKTLPQLIN